MLDARLRTGVGKALAPIGRGLRSIGVTANVLTVVGLACSGLTAWLIAVGQLRWAVLGLVASGLIDLLDGSVARTSGEASPRGAFFDSVTDRVSDAVVLGGCAWYLASQGPHLPVLAFAAAALSMLISYERARAEGLGYTAKGGLMERAERMVVLGIGLMFNVLVPVLWIMVVLMSFTAIQRFVLVWRQASDTPVPRVRRLGLVRHRRVDDEDLGLAAGDEGRGLTAWWEARRVGTERRGPPPRRPVRRNTRP
jgi:CDP-diacylglycerol--glycerol-3-phosphate 3-phosphatidyltransferase